MVKYLIGSALTLTLLGSTALAQGEEPQAPEQPPAQTADTENLPLPLDEVRIFTQVLEQIRSAYVEPLDDKTLLENAIKGMLAGIDPHSTYLDEDTFDQLNESTTGEFGGLGVEISVQNGVITVISPMEDSPAERAGIEAGDMIIKLGDQPVRDMNISDTTDMMRGDPGTDITLTIVREGVLEPFEVTVTREIITAKSVRYDTLEPGYGYIRIIQFAANTGDETRKAIVDLREENSELKGLVLDLRNNPGGVLQTAVEVVDSFIDDGLIVYTEGRLPNAEMEFEATPNDPSQGVPLVVLINNGSASASEIVAGALQDHGRAVIMGTSSFGKGSVQTVLPLDEERAIKLTTALYYTPSGRSIQALGIVPDIRVEQGQVTRNSGSVAAYREADLSGHLENNGEQSTARPAATSTEEPEVIVEDYQLHEAVNLLKGLQISRSLR